jgi:hypothetical protein
LDAEVGYRLDLRQATRVVVVDFSAKSSTPVFDLHVVCPERCDFLPAPFGEERVALCIGATRGIFKR